MSGVRHHRATIPGASIFATESITISSRGILDGMDTAAEILTDVLRTVSDGELLVITGAGISLASGIPTFRGSDPEAIWHRDVTELGTRAYFERDPVGSWRWYLERFDAVLSAEPNPGHLALADLEGAMEDRGGEMLLVTQNVDTLHEKAGSRRLVKIHGSADRVRCSRDGCEYGAPGGSLPRSDVDLREFLREPLRENLPRCPACDALLRQHVLWFDEYYQGHDDYRFDEVVEAGGRAELFLFVGTSFSVGITDILLSLALRRRRPVLAVDPAGDTGRILPGVTFLAAAAEDILPAVCENLSQGGDPPVVPPAPTNDRD